VATELARMNTDLKFRSDPCESVADLLSVLHRQIHSSQQIVVGWLIAQAV
jgi:hypothetical protein